MKALNVYDYIVVVVYMVMIVGIGLIGSFAFIPAPLSDRMINLCLSLVLGAFGWLMFCYGKKNKSRL